MAIDTRNKRSSAIGIDMNWNRVYPNPDNSISSQDRQHAAVKYSGIDAGGASAVQPPLRTLVGWGL